LVESGEKETPLQKYHRLQCEMQELLEEVTQLKVRSNILACCMWMSKGRDVLERFLLTVLLVVHYAQISFFGGVCNSISSRAIRVLC
jgi:hypothetical protein